MHSNIITLAFCVLAIPASVTARPNVYSLSERSIEPIARAAHPITLRRRNQRAQVEQLSCNTQPAAAAGQEAAVGNQQKEAAAGNQQKEAAAGNKQKETGAANKEKEAAVGNKEKEAAAGNKEGAADGEAAAGEEAAKENEVEIESAFDAAVAVQGGDLKQDLVFTPSTVGKFEFEFQNDAADEITVTENVGAATAGAPAGFEAIEPNSYTVALAVSKGAGVTLSKIDYIFDAASAGLVGKDVTKAQVGKLCAETGAFVISGLLGELEFEVEENEVTLNLNKNVTAEGQWGIFLPIAAAAGAAEGNAGAAEKDKAAAEKEKAAAEKDKAAAEKEKLAAEKEAKQKQQAAAETAKKEKAATEAAKKQKEAAAKAAEELAKKEKAAAEAAPKDQAPAAPAAPAHEAAMKQKAAEALAMAAQRTE